MPHVAIIDPRTGEMLKHWNGFIGYDVLMDEIPAFLESHSLEDEFVPKKMIEKPNKKKELVDATEEEQLAAAIEASMQNSTTESESQPNILKRKETEFVEDTALQGQKKQKSKENIVFEESKVQESDEGEGDCLIQIRESNGNIFKRKFQSFDTIQVLHDYVSKHRTDGKQPFSLMTTFPKKIYQGELLTRTLKEENLFPRAVLTVSLNS